MSGFIYFLHGIFWSAFFVRVIRQRGDDDDLTTPPVSRRKLRARHALLLAGFQAIAFVVMYERMLAALAFPDRQTTLVPSLWPLAIPVILGAIGLFGWALWFCGTWHVLPKIDEGHELGTGGPYQWLRHPIYVACDLLAIGTFLWIPTFGMSIALLLVLVSSHVRMRGEEKVLAEAFGDEYRDYCRQTDRYVPGVF